VTKPIYALLISEAPFIIAGLALYGIADPNTYRSRLWQDGFDNGFNSSPAQPIYDLVNGGQMHVPLVWSQFITQFNLTISLLTVFILLVKSIAVIMGVMYPGISLLVHGLELALWAVSVHGQSAPDTSDPEHPSYGAPWYITKPCSVAKLSQDVGYCEQAKASFFVALFLVIIFALHVMLSVHSIMFAPEGNPGDEESRAESKGKQVDRQWEMVPVPSTPGTPFGRMPMSPMTPRTRAFGDLEGNRRLSYRQSYPEPPPLSFPPPPTKAKKGKK